MIDRKEILMRAMMRVKLGYDPHATVTPEELKKRAEKTPHLDKFLNLMEEKDGKD